MERCHEWFTQRIPLLVRCMRPRNSTEFVLGDNIPLLLDEELDAYAKDLESFDTDRLGMQPCRAVLAHCNCIAALDNRFRADIQQTSQLRETAINFVFAGRLQAMTNLQQKCCVCASTQRLMRCGGCNLIQYCSVQCRDKDWKTHKKTCEAIKRWSDEISCSNMVAALRIIKKDIIPFSVCCNAETPKAMGIALACYHSREYKAVFATTKEVVFMIFLGQKNTRHPLLHLHHSGLAMQQEVNCIRDTKAMLKPSSTITFTDMFPCNDCRREEAAILLEGCTCTSSIARMPNCGFHGKTLCRNCYKTRRLKKLQKCECGNSITRIVHLQREPEP